MAIGLLAFLIGLIYTVVMEVPLTLAGGWCKVLFRFKSFLCFSVASTHGAKGGLGREQVVHTKYLSVGLHP